ncbi:MAG: alpha/beta hydrolase [Cyanobacteriota bacterium]|nr:alpha/beta hydrolase [Cyanobacteriota bacterium]
MPNVRSRKFRSLLSAGCALTLGILPAAWPPKPALSADRIFFALGPLDFSVAVDSLERFADDGSMNTDLAFFASRLNDRQLEQFRQVLQRRFDANHVTLSRLTYTPMGEALLKRVGRLIQLDRDLNGYKGIRAAVVLAAAQPDGFTILDVLRQFPGEDIRLNTDFVFEVVRELTALIEYRDAALEAIDRQAASEAATEPVVDFAQLPDLRQPGPYEVIERTVTFRVNRLRQTQLGVSATYDLEVLMHLPEDNPQPAPLVVITHGFGSTVRSYEHLSRHLASHGIAVASPAHIGSNLDYREGLLAGLSSNLISPIEYINRAEDVTTFLDELERLVAADSSWAGQLDLERVGILGYSFGGTNALSLAGADLNLRRLNQDCVPGLFALNISLLVQCRATYLPPGNYDLGDSRLKAVLAAYPASSYIYGPESIGQIQIPTLLVASSNDIITPAIPEQIHPFVWLNTPEKYLAAIVPGTHFSSAQAGVTDGLPSFLSGPRPDLGRGFLFALNVAFFQTYLNEDPDYLPYLGARYADYLSSEELKLQTIRSLDAAQLETAFGETPPLAIIPEPAIAENRDPEDSVLEEIRQTGILKVAMRGDAAPLGYIDSQERLWTGYCADLFEALADRLTEQLDRPEGIEVVRLSSDLGNRFDLVRDNTVHLECGPNSI